MDLGKENKTKKQDSLNASKITEKRAKTTDFDSVKIKLESK